MMQKKEGISKAEVRSRNVNIMNKLVTIAPAWTTTIQNDLDKVRRP